MKYIIAAFLLMGIIPLLAQEDITKENFPSIGDGGLYKSSGPIPLNKTPDELTGVDYNWEFTITQIPPHPYEIVWKDIEDAPELHKEDFSNADIYEYNSNTKEYRYYSITDTSFNLLGRYISGFPQVFEEPAVDFKYPLSFQDEYINEYRIDETTRGINIINYDGKGSLTINETKELFFDNVFRLKFTSKVIYENEDDTSTSVQYKWFQRNGNHPVLVVTQIEENNFSIEYKVSGFTGIDQQLSSDTQVFPNPASEFLNIKLPDVTALDFELIDQNGKLIRTQKFEENIDISDLQSGMYYIKINTIGDKKIVRKFIKK